MTEVKSWTKSPEGPKGLFATKAYACGDVILKEVPAVTLTTSNIDDEELLLSKFFDAAGDQSNGKKEGKTTERSVWNEISPPSSVAAESHGTFRGMARAGLCWIEKSADLPQQSKDAVLELYHPEDGKHSKVEKILLDTSTACLEYLRGLCKASGATLDDESTRAVMLIWACNAFQGGRIYPKISRVNHNCNPNAIIQVDGETQKLVAAADISADEEISISYLGLLLYTEKAVRRSKLRLTKFFYCECKRCIDEATDVASCVPCPVQHPRELPQQSLEEEVQYDDEQDVNYVVSNSFADTDGKNSKFEGDNPKLSIVMKNVTKKVLDYLDTQERDGKMDSDDDDDDAEEAQTIVEEHLGLASSIMGDRHWSTNLLKLIHLNRHLSQVSKLMITTQELPDLDEVAEIIDSLQRVERFADSLKLKLNKGHILGDVIIGVARTLVSLGDEKSQKYGADWLEKLGGYFDQFEPQGVKIVVSALKGAWKKSADAKERPSKKSRKS